MDSPRMACPGQDAAHKSGRAHHDPRVRISEGYPRWRQISLAQGDSPRVSAARYRGGPLPETCKPAPDAAFAQGFSVTVMFPQYFGVPQKVIRGGLWPKMKPSEQSLYVCLLHESERYSTRAFRRTDAQLRALSGVSPRAFCNARKKLQERGLISYNRGRGNVYNYVICDPETGRSWPGDSKRPVLYKKKGDALNDGTLQRPVPVAGWKKVKTHPGGLPPSPRCAAPSSSSVKPHDRLEEYGLPGLFK